MRKRQANEMSEVCTVLPITYASFEFTYVGPEVYVN